jgi:hypothetical protein
MADRTSSSLRKVRVATAGAKSGDFAVEVVLARPNLDAGVGGRHLVVADALVEPRSGRVAGHQLLAVDEALAVEDVDPGDGPAVLAVAAITVLLEHRHRLAGQLGRGVVAAPGDRHRAEQKTGEHTRSDRSHGASSAAEPGRQFHAPDCKPPGEDKQAGRMGRTSAAGRWSMQ